jgi:hypothetical protein
MCVLLAVKDVIVGAAITFTVVLPVALTPIGFVTVQVSVKTHGVPGAMKPGAEDVGQQ